MMSVQPALLGLMFLPFAAVISVWVAISDMSRMKIPNKAVMALFGVYAVVGLAAGWWLAGAGLVARGRHLMVPELSSGAPGSPYAAMHFRTKMHAGFLLDSGPGGSLARWGGVPVCPKSL